MSDASSNLYLVTPPIAETDAIAPVLEEACRSGRIAAVLLGLAAGDERSLVNRVKALCPIVQRYDAALIVGAPEGVDLVSVAGRGGADGVHVPAGPDLSALRERLKDGRILGVGALRSKHDAMTAGEAGADYVMFGEPRPDRSVPNAALMLDRAQWWAEIFSTPCVAFASSLDQVSEISATGAEFVALGDAVWNHPEGPALAVGQAERLTRTAAPA